MSHSSRPLYAAMIVGASCGGTVMSGRGDPGRAHGDWPGQQFARAVTNACFGHSTTFRNDLLPLHGRK